MSDATQVYNTLPRQTQRLIDRVFSQLAESTGGGGGGGFIVESDDSDSIPLSKIPEALDLLKLPSDDAEVIQVFTNAAGGWDTSSSSSSSGGVTLADFRSVCAVLLESPNEENFEEDEDAGEESDEYAEDDSEDSDYGSRPSKARRTRRRQSTSSASPSPARQRRRKASPSPSSSSNELTADQLETALLTYALFFPPIPLESGSPQWVEKVSNQRLMIGDIQRAAGLLKEKLGLEDITTMLSLFSTSPDMSMSFDDFTRMLIRAKLV
ncbi:hypothetical protein BKA70DRAFT_202149 [Coprinopsis sp. MPI-PUGE-AT-0042]|nr:hypothetical protein BKA70DRAFT_202149 [Coprinopsis sp. MPI-PUGE-AT-0042]